MSHSEHSHMSISTGDNELTVIQFVITPGLSSEIPSLLKTAINAITDERDCVRQVLAHAYSNLEYYLADSLNLGVARYLAHDGTNPLMEEVRIYVKNDYTGVEDKSQIYADFDGSTFE